MPKIIYKVEKTKIEEQIVVLYTRYDPPKARIRIPHRGLTTLATDQRISTTLSTASVSFLHLLPWIGNTKREQR